MQFKVVFIETVIVLNEFRAEISRRCLEFFALPILQEGIY